MSTSSPLITLRCAIVGRRDIATVEVISELPVGHLQELIKFEKRLYVDAKVFLRLYLATPRAEPDSQSQTQTQSAWLHTTDEDYEALARGDAQTRASYFTAETKMDPEKPLKDYFPSQPDESEWVVTCTFDPLPVMDKLLHLSGRAWFTCMEWMAPEETPQSSVGKAKTEKRFSRDTPWPGTTNSTVAGFDVLATAKSGTHS